MTQIAKLLRRFLGKPRDLTWDELVIILNYFGYCELPAGKIGGSRRKFVDAQKRIISLHKPHPSKIVKSYVIEQLIANLKQNGKIEHD